MGEMRLGSQRLDRAVRRAIRARQEFFAEYGLWPDGWTGMTDHCAICRRVLRSDQARYEGPPLAHAYCALRLAEFGEALSESVDE